MLMLHFKYQKIDKIRHKNNEYDFPKSFDPILKSELYLPLGLENVERVSAASPFIVSVSSGTIVAPDE